MHPHQERIGTCNFCGSEDFRVLHHYEKDFYPHAAYNTFPWDGNHHAELTIGKCGKCGLVYQNPRFKAEHLGEVYTVMDAHPIDLEKTVASHKFKPLVDLIQKNCPPAKNSESVSIDIGTRYGLLPEVLRREGFNAYGVEFNGSCVEAARVSGFKQVFQGTIESIPALMKQQALNRLHLITMTDVIEHLLDPMGDLQLLANCQQSGDHMVIQTIDVSSWGHKIFGKWWYHFHAQHTYYFDIPMLRAYYNRIGYDVVDVLKVKSIHNLSLLPSVWKAFNKHKANRQAAIKGDVPAEKLWYAADKPTLYDIITIVARKR
ncbi:MAG: class I SAM-dependent methyltransferase [Flavobacteriales bacterium]|jgi:hypothetical protein